MDECVLSKCFNRIEEDFAWLVAYCDIPGFSEAFSELMNEDTPENREWVYKILTE